jgi:alpha-beta hydrolase superfamily lysophospholipase
MRQTENGKARRRPWGLVLASAGLVAWVAYRVTNTRSMRAPLAADAGGQTGPGAEADLSRFNQGLEPIRCRPWEIGTGVRGYVWEAPEPRAVLLLQHGYGEYAQRFVERYSQLIPHLLNAGLSVYAIDLWGHGHSPGRRAVTDLGQAVEDHLAARRKLRGQPLPLFVFGHSLGGLVTATSVAREQSGLSGVILSSPFLRKEVAAWKRLLVNVFAAVGPTLPAPEKPAELSGLSRIPEELDFVENDPLIYRGRAPMLLAATALNLLEDNPSLYQEWRLPTLVLHGTADTYTDPEGSRELFKTIASQDKTLHIVEGGHHELLNDKERDETLRVLLAWLGRRLPPNGA